MTPRRPAALVLAALAVALGGCRRVDERVLEAKPASLEGTKRYDLAPPFQHARAQLLVCARLGEACVQAQEPAVPVLPFTARAYSDVAQGFFPMRAARGLGKGCERCLWYHSMPHGAYSAVELAVAAGGPVTVTALRLVSMDAP